MRIGAKNVLVFMALLSAGCQPPAPDKQSYAPQHVEMATLKVDILQGGAVRLNGELVTKAELVARLQAAAIASPQPEVHFSADRLANYRDVAGVMELGQRLGLTKKGVIGGT